MVTSTAKDKASTMRAAIYARVSTGEQTCENQLLELRSYIARRGWTVAGEYVDEGVSGAKDRRPSLDKLMADARRGRVDVIVVWALDRFGRSLRHLVTSIDELGALKVGFNAITQGIDTTSSSPASTLTLQVLGAVAQFERSLTIDRVKAGIARARAQGKQLGRPRRSFDRDRVLELRRAGYSQRAISRETGVSKTVVLRFLAGQAGGDDSGPQSPASLAS